MIMNVLNIVIILFKFTSHSAFVATSTESHGVKINGYYDI